MAGFSGKLGTVKVGNVAIAEVTGWTFEPKVNVPKYDSNDTGGFKAAVAGVKDSSGKIEIKMDSDGNIPWEPGDSATLILQVDNTGNNAYTVPAIVSTSPVEVDINDGEIVGATFNFEGNGAWNASGICAKV